MFGVSLPRKFGRIAPACSVAALAACAAPSSYMGISLNSNATDIAIQQQAWSAMNGDKHAQLGLGIRFEQGLGVGQDLSKAKKLYRKAASDSGGAIWVYTSPVGNGTSGRVVPVNTGQKLKGLIEARQRLENIE